MAMLIQAVAPRLRFHQSGQIDFMPLYWLCYSHNHQISVVIEPGASLIHACMRASLAGLDEGTFTEAHELDRKTERQVPKAMIGRRLSQEEAKRLLGEGDSPSLLGGQARMVGMT
jgi:hypothetical protein